MESRLSKTQRISQDLVAKLWRKTAGHPQMRAFNLDMPSSQTEILFDEGLGDLFIVRVIGNVSRGDEAGSAEYGVEHLGTPLLVVLGHTGCGAVTAAITHAKAHGNVPPLLTYIRPSVHPPRHVARRGKV
jgi:carbonic anhydrase